MADKKAVMIIAAEGFRDEELLNTKAALEKAGVKVDVASTTIKQAKGTLGAVVIPDKLISNINAQDYDAVIFVGGSGCRQYWYDNTAHSIVKESAASGKITAGICSGAVILANAGVLMGKKATSFPGDRQQMLDMGVNYTAKSVEVDDNFITADGPGSATAFGEKIVEKLGK